MRMDDRISVKVAKALYRALVRPMRSARPVQPIRALLRIPRAFDVTSWALQTRDLRRLARIRDAYPAADGPHHRSVQDYNAGVTLKRPIQSTRQAEIYYELLALPPRDQSREKLLIVGPRSVHELLVAWLHGFSWRNISGIDLYSTNPKIAPMNMESMTFADESFDAVAMASTLAYAEDTFAALNEVARVLRPGGRFAFGATFDPGGADKWPEGSRGGAEIHGMLRRLGLDVYFHDSVDKTNSQRRRQTTHRFACVKPDPRLAPLDPLVL
jgi:SAM-dependent methyltransferase